MVCIFEYHRFLPVAPIAAVLLLQARTLDISRMAKRVIKKVKRVCSKRGQPKGKPRKKKTFLEIHDKAIIQPTNIPEGAISS